MFILSGKIESLNPEGVTYLWHWAELKH
jgi:hypothetical protein